MGDNMESEKLIISDIFYEYSEKAQTIKGDTHYHNNYEIYYLTEGSCRYFIGNNSYRLTSGDIALIPRGVIHKTNYENKKRSRILLSCPESYIPLSVRKKFSKIPLFPKSIATAQKIKEIFECIEKEYRNPDEFSEDVIRFKIGELLFLIVRNYDSNSYTREKYSLINRAIGYIQNNYASNITLSQTAEHCFVSSEHLSRTFKKETGFGFREFLNIYRLKKAESILKFHPEYKIVDVALSCGFNDSNYFSKVYKQVYKVSPTQAKMKGE